MQILKYFTIKMSQKEFEGTMFKSHIPKSILCTGAAGFIGSNVAIYLLKKYIDYRVIVLDRLDPCSNLKNLDEIVESNQFKFVKGDISSIDLVIHILKYYEIDTVIHFAACSFVDASFGNSIEFTKSNVLGTHNLLESCKSLGNQIKRFIHVSTDEVYQQVHPDSSYLCSESSILDPQNPYAASKAAAECIVRSYYHSFKLPIIMTRSSNVIGPRQFLEKIIPKFTTRILNGLTCCIHGDGSHRRSYIYIDDVCEAFDIILHKGVTGEIYNIGNRK